MTINPILIGGFGNRLYQLANALRLQDLYECDLVFHVIKPEYNDHSKFRMLIHKETDLDEFGGHGVLKKQNLPQTMPEIFPYLNWNLSNSNLNDILESKRICFEHNILQIDPNFDTVVMGYFFSYFFVKDYVKKLKENFAPCIIDYVNKSYPDLNNKRILGLHLRLGIESDNTPAIEVPNSFYETIINDCKNDYDEIYVVSDNIRKASIFIDRFKIDKPIKFIDNEPMFVDLIILSKCSILMIAPSTLSAWSAFLNNNQDSIYVPKIWTSHHWTEDIPKTWKLL
jgi:hypothetical protein